MTRQFFLVAVSWLATAAPCAAQVDSAHDLGTTHAAYGRLFLRDYANCVAGLAHDSAKKFVLATGNQRVSDEDRRRVQNGYCASTPSPNFVAKALQFKGMLAEALVQREKKGWPVLNPLGLPPIDWSVPDLEPDPRDPLNPSRAALAKLREMALAENKVGRLGECVVRANPTAAAAALNTPMDDPAEAIAFKTLTPEIVGCIKDGETSVFNRTDLLSAVALSYYRLANAQSSAGR